MSVRIETHAEPIPGYTLLDRLGSGGFGEVWRAEAPGGIFKAIKIIHGDLLSKDHDLVRYAEQELKALKRVKQVRHPYLLALNRYDIVDGRLMITMELADCNLWDRFREYRDRGLPGIPRDELLLYMAETAEVLDLFNDQFQLQHLDIKPQNLFLLYNHVKVADFGQVKDLQGLMAAVTGGITPVYAAPETFDGIITRYCDQYSLACVYQELLTGTRPFDGCSMGQLLMQHLNLPPNLVPSPSCDRPALLRALAKKPEDRWPSVSEFVRGLRAAGPVSARVAHPQPRMIHDTPTIMAPDGAMPAAAAPPQDAAAPVSGGSRPVLPPLVAPGDTPPPRVVESVGPVFTPAPPESSGPGPLRPALVVGIGQAGLRVLQRLRFDMRERYGPQEMTPSVRTLYVDTDPDALEECRRDRPLDRLAGLSPDDVFAARLNRASHYMKPRLNGRNLTEGWFDPSLLYKIPRTPQTLGMRIFGRLAFCDHYRAFVGRVHAELEQAVSAEALARTEFRTGLQMRTNRPRVYIVASLAGGTGGGMFLDAAYAVRARLRRMGYTDPEVVGVLVVPPADPSLTPAQALGNAYAALTELHHFSRPGATFSAYYDDRNGALDETGPPFTHCFLVPGSAAGLYPPPAQAGTTRGRTPSTISAPPPRTRPESGGVSKPGSRLVPAPGSRAVPKPGSRVMPALGAQRTPDPSAAHAAFKPYADAADLIRLNLFSSIGRVADDARSARSGQYAPSGFTLTAFGLAAFSWPRAEVVARTAAKVSRAVLHRWATLDVQRAREVVPAIAQQKWSQLGLDPDTLLGHLQRAAERVAGGKIDEQIAAMTDPLVPRGWLARLPEPAQVSITLDRLVKLLGPPSAIKRLPTAVEEALTRSATDAGGAFGLDVCGLVPTLVEDPQFRLAGTEELLRQFLATTERLTDKFFNAACELDAKALVGFECVSQYAHLQKGTRKPGTSDFGEAVKLYPRARFQALTFRALGSLYQTVRESLVAQIADVSAARQRLEAAANAPERQAEAPEPPSDNRRLMPPGCATLTDAVDRFLAVLTDTDLDAIDRRLVESLEPERGGVLQACLTSGDGADAVAATVFEETRAHLDVRLGEVDLAGMFAERYRTPQQAERVLEQTYQEAEPVWIGVGPWAAGEVAVLGCPAGAGGEPLRELARRAIPVGGLPIADTPDDLTVYREWPGVPLAALPHLGAPAAAAFQSLAETQQCSPHTRLDVTQWVTPEE